MYGGKMRANGLPVDKIICGDCLEVMAAWPDDFIDCVVTSPPYWGLRDYGIEGQLGLEKTPEEYLTKMVAVFREVRLVLKKTGTLWLNMGDSYANTGVKDPSKVGGFIGERIRKKLAGQNPNDSCQDSRPKQIPPGLKPKDLCMMPHRLAMALQKDGWWIRSDIVWAKPNPMPESVTDRPTKSHEYIFLCTKSAKYFYDADVIREESVPDPRDKLWDTARTGKGFSDHKHDAERGRMQSKTQDEGWTRMSNPAGRNKRSVWTVATAPYSEAHFATFPPKLIEPCILAGCPEWVCKKCGKAKERIIEASGGSIGKGWHDHENDQSLGQRATDPKSKGGHGYKVETTGWTDCGCNAGFDGGIVFDPFMGSGTTAVVAYENRRHYLGIELNQEYIDLNRIDKIKGKYALIEK
jgi:DNA modification methylase